VTKSAKICAQCMRRPAVAVRSPKSGGRPSRASLADHDLCRQCWRSLLSSAAPKRSRNRMDGVLDELCT
jgi:hypothetical protein